MCDVVLNKAQQLLSVCSFQTMASRGRGRGKNYPRPGRGGQSRGGGGGGGGGQKVPSNAEELGTYLHSLNDSNFDAYGAMFADMVLNYSSNEHKLEEAVSLIFDATVQSRDYAPLGAKVCEKVAMASNEDEPDPKHQVRSEFRKMLMKRFHFEFNQKEQIRTTSIEAWLGVFTFLCEVYARIKVNDEPIKVLGSAIMSVVQFHFDQLDIVPDEIDCICSNLKLCGRLVEKQNPEKFMKVFTELRKRVISRKTSCQARCAILELIEYRHMGWHDPQKTLDKFYIDAMADAVAEDELGEDFQN